MVCYVKQLFITYAEMGVVIDKFEDIDDCVILLFTVPKSSYNIDAKGEQKYYNSYVKDKYDWLIEKYGLEE